jgi:hypothetical protein
LYFPFNSLRPVARLGHEAVDKAMERSESWGAAGGEQGVRETMSLAVLPRDFQRAWCSESQSLNCKAQDNLQASNLQQPGTLEKRVFLHFEVRSLGILLSFAL